MTSTVIYQPTGDNTQIDEIHQICSTAFPESYPWRLSDCDRVHGEYKNISYCISITGDSIVSMIQTAHYHFSQSTIHRIFPVSDLAKTMRSMAKI